MNATANAGTQTAAAPAAEGAVLLTPALVRDPARNDMPAYRLMVPEGWTVSGGVTAPQPAYSMIPYFSDVTVEGPDGRGARFYGVTEFGYADGVQLPLFTPYQGRPFFPLQPSLGAFWQQVFAISPQPGVTDLEVVSEDVLPEATELVQQHLASLYESTRRENAQLAMSGQQKSFDVHVRRLVIRYRKDGQPIEATVFATVRHAIYRYMNGMIRAAMWNLDGMYAVFGPVGSDPLNDPVIAAVVRSRQELPEWQVAVQRWYLMKNRQIVAEGQARIAAAARAAASSASQTSSDVLDISFNGWKRRNAMNDAGQASSVRGIHERTTYATPSGSTVDLPSFYQNVYADGQGNFVLHNDANYQINTDPAFNSRDWQRVDPVP
jgi:hypothetical protein